jgi:hypothetical protein
MKGCGKRLRPGLIFSEYFSFFRLPSPLVLLYNSWTGEVRLAEKLLLTVLLFRQCLAGSGGRAR